MITFTGNPRIFLCKSPMDMRNGFEGLSAAVQHFFSEEVTSGNFFVFLNKPRDRMKILYWDTDGLAIWNKRLEKGRFLKLESEKALITRREFFMILEGITPKHIQKRYNVF